MAETTARHRLPDGGVGLRGWWRRGRHRLRPGHGFDVETLSLIYTLEDADRALHRIDDKLAEVEADLAQRYPEPRVLTPEEQTRIAELLRGEP